MWAEAVSVPADNLNALRLPHGAGAPDLVFCFGATELLERHDTFRRVQEAFPDAIHVGCSTCTSVSNSTLHEEHVSVLQMGFAATPLRMATHRFEADSCSRAVGRALGEQLVAEDLAGVFVLTDGLSVNGSDLVRGLVDACGPNVVISGGLAGDGHGFARTLVGIDGEAVSNAAVAVGFYGSNVRIAHGSAGGWDEFGPRRRITRASGNILHELDGGPALDLYERYLGDEAAELPASALYYPLSVWNPDQPEDRVVRTVLAVDRDERTMTFAGDVPEGWTAQLMRGSFDRLTEGASQAGAHAAANLDEAVAPQACLFISCVGRRLVMQQRTDDEVLVVTQKIGENVPMAGFYSYGELAPNNNTGVCGLHNQTVTLTILAERSA